MFGLFKWAMKMHPAGVNMEQNPPDQDGTVRGRRRRGCATWTHWATAWGSLNWTQIRTNSESKTNSTNIYLYNLNTY